MELSANRRDITITRTTHAKNAPMREFSACYTGTSTPVKELSGTNSGEMLTGVSKEVFRRSAFIAQGDIGLTGGAELEKRINAIVSTGEEQTSYTEADAKLRTWQRKRRYNRRGYLPELEGQIDETQRRLGDMSAAVDTLSSLDAQLDSARKECARLEQAVNDSRKKQRREALNALGACQATLKRCNAEHDEAMAELSAKREALRRSDFAGMSADEADEQTAADLRAVSALSKDARKKANPLLAILMLIIAAAGAALYINLQYFIFIPISVLTCITAIVLLFRVSKTRRSARDALDRRREIFMKYRASSTAEIKAAAADYRALWEDVHSAEAREKSARAAYENARDAVNDIQQHTLQELDFSTGSSEAAALGRELAAARAKAERLAAQTANISGRLAAMGDPLVLSSSLSALRDKYETINCEYDAITLAVDTLKEADLELQSRFSPELGKAAARYMSVLTGGRYSDVLLNRDFSARAKTQSDTVAHDAEYLSAGTLDLLYLAVRLAVCELALPEGESCPLIIDDALVNLDDERHAQAMELLKQISADRQVILFTCRN